MAVTAPAVTAALASQILAERFGLSGDLTPLGSERDQNFSVVTAGGERFVLKISNPAESATVLDFQAQALLHVAQQAPGMPVPHIVPAKDGRPLVRIETPAGPCMVRVVRGWPACRCRMRPGLRGSGAISAGRSPGSASRCAGIFIRRHDIRCCGTWGEPRPSPAWRRTSRTRRGAR